MFVTKFGNFDGKSWEDMFQVILKRKYMPVNYQRVKASPGDYGIEGFTGDGQTFQCYCPDFNTDDETLYDKQRDKITRDINKLRSNAKELEELLGGIKLKKWVFITPHMGHRDLLLHCQAKKDLVLSWNLVFIENDFNVLVHEVSDYAIEVGEYFEQTTKKFVLTPDKVEVHKDRIVQWKDTQIDLVKNALDKNRIRIESLKNKNDLDAKTNVLTDETIKFFLNGESILRKWQSAQPENHQRFIELLASVEEELKERCLLSTVEPNELVKEVTVYVEERIRGSFTYLDESTVIRLKNYSAAFWILRCPLYFETNNNEN